MKRNRLTFALAVIVVLGCVARLSPSAIAESNPDLPVDRALCEARVPGADYHFAPTQENVLSIADRFFVRGDYQGAFTLYYQQLLCPEDTGIASGTGTDPRANEGLRALTAAIAEGSRGEYTEGLALLKGPVQRDALFADGQFIEAQLYWAAGNHNAAIELWLENLKNPGYVRSNTDCYTPLRIFVVQRLLLELANRRMPKRPQVDCHFR